jgi:hypothetical protein
LPFTTSSINMTAPITRCTKEEKGAVIIHLWTDDITDAEIQWRPSAIKSWRKRLVCGLLSTRKHFFFLNGIHKLVKYWIMCIEMQEGYVQKLCTCVMYCCCVNFNKCIAPIFWLTLTYGAEPFLRSCQLCSHSRTSQHLMEPEGALPCSQEPSTGPYLEPDQCSPYHPILSLSKIYYNTAHPPTNCLRSDLFPSGLPTNIPHAFLFSPIDATCPAHLSLPVLIILIMSC